MIQSDLQRSQPCQLLNASRTPLSPTAGGHRLGQGVGMALVSVLAQRTAGGLLLAFALHCLGCVSLRPLSLPVSHNGTLTTNNNLNTHARRWPAVIMPTKTVQDNDSTTKQVVFLVDNTAALVKSGTILPFSTQNHKRLLSPASLQDKVRVRSWLWVVCS